MRKPLRYSFAVLVFTFLLSLAASNASSEGADLVITSLDYTNDFETGERCASGIRGLNRQAPRAELIAVVVQRLVETRKCEDRQQQRE